MIRALRRAKRDGFKVIYIDETVFTRSTVPRTEYCLQNRNVTVDKDWINEPTVAVLSGISRERGQELYIQFPKSCLSRMPGSKILKNQVTNRKRGGVEP